MDNDENFPKTPSQRKKKNEQFGQGVDGDGSVEFMVTKNPHSSSAGYANTFRILENQIRRNKLLKHSSLSSISEEEPSFFDLELAARSRLKEMCDNSNSSVIIAATESLNRQFKYDNVQNFIYHVSKSPSGLLTLKPKHLTIPITTSIDDNGNDNNCSNKSFSRTLKKLVVV